VATGFGIGFIPYSPGTAGTILAVFLFWLLKGLIWYNYFVVTLAFTLFAIYISGKAEIIFAKKDAPFIVIDEIAGFLWAMLLLSPSPRNLLLSFLFFRFFDIIKPYPVKLMQNKLPGGWGVVGDDVMAGILSTVSLNLLFRYLL